MEFNLWHGRMCRASAEEQGRISMATPNRVLRGDGKATYDRILEAAGEQFSAAGYAETTSKKIAAAAGVDVASINYHFGSRSGLYRAVLVEAHRQLMSVEFIHQLAASNYTAKDKLKKFLESAIEAAMGNQGWHTLVLSREMLSPSSHLDALRQGEVFIKFKAVFAILSEITGISEDDPALLRCLISVVAPCSLLRVAKQSLSIINEGISEMPREALVEHLWQFSLGGLEAVSRNHHNARNILAHEEQDDEQN